MKFSSEGYVWQSCPIEWQLNGRPVWIVVLMKCYEWVLREGTHLRLGGILAQVWLLASQNPPWWIIIRTEEGRETNLSYSVHSITSSGLPCCQINKCLTTASQKVPTQDWFSNLHISWKFDRQLGSTAVEMHVKFQTVWEFVNSFLHGFEKCTASDRPVNFQLLYKSKPIF